ncbi:MAG: efflux transporter, family, subunit [Firmicutes bacterium]|nr:efflux transporter, family, subunit [Bacillota bacterium]
MRNFIQQHRKAILLTVILLLVAIVLAAQYDLLSCTLWTKPKPPVNVSAVSVSIINKPIQIARAGSVENAAFVPINSEFTGLLSEIYVSNGQSVKSGQPLFKLTATAVQSATSETSTIKTTTAKPEVQPGPDTYEAALKEYNRFKELYDIGGIPRRQLEAAAARLQEAEKNRTNSPSATPSTPGTATPVNSFTTIKAPTDGIVSGLSIASGQTVQSGQQLMALGNGQEVEIVVQIEQNDLYLAHLGTPAIIEVANQSLPGQVSSIYPKVEGNQVTSFLVHIRLTNNPSGLLKAGMPVNVRIETGKSGTVIAVPTASIFQDKQGCHFIYIAANGIAVRQQINIGETIGDFTEITSDLPQESMIITNNLDKIKNGAAIELTQ